MNDTNFNYYSNKFFVINLWFFSLKNFKFSPKIKNFEGETFLEILCKRLWVTQLPEANDEVVFIFGCQLMRVPLGKNEPWSSFPALATLLTSNFYKFQILT